MADRDDLWPRTRTPSSFHRPESESIDLNLLRTNGSSGVRTQGVLFRSTAARSSFNHASCARLHTVVHVSTPLYPFMLSATRCVSPKLAEKYREVCDGTVPPEEVVAGPWWLPAERNAPMAEVAELWPCSFAACLRLASLASGMSSGPHFSQVWSRKRLLRDPCVVCSAWRQAFALRERERARVEYRE